MKRFILALTFCSLLLFLVAFIMAPSSGAREDLITSLLNLPAPPPPNPLVDLRSLNRPDSFFDRKNPPSDDAPIEDLLDYWKHQNRNFRNAAYNPKPSDKVIERIMPEIEKEPRTVLDYLNVIKYSSRGVESVKRLYDSWSEGENDSRARMYDSDHGEGASPRQILRNWLTSNSPYFSDDLERQARQTGDVNGYVRNDDEFHDLTRNDWDRAQPMVDRLYNDSGNPASQALARWALYRQAIKTNALDVERFRDELKATVENRDLPDAVRDLSLDALLIEKEWPGRDEWYYSLMSDETLVGIKGYTGLTTFMLQSPDDKYIDKMIEFAKSENRVVRTAAARNLLLRLETGRPEIIRALLPGLTDPKWVLEDVAESSREMLVRRLAMVKMPESVPGLIAALDEKGKREAFPGFLGNVNAAANATATVANAVAAAANMVSNSNANVMRGPSESYYPLRNAAVSALAMQADARAVPALRRILPQVEEYERIGVVHALWASGGFTVLEQADALEYVAEEQVTSDMYNTYAANAMNTAPGGYTIRGDIYTTNAVSGTARKQPLDPNAVKRMLGMNVLQSKEISDQLIRELVRRIDSYEKTDPEIAERLRRMFANWTGAAVNALLLRDLKRDKSNVKAVVKLLSIRKELREKQPGDVFDIRTGSPTAVGISACLLEAEEDYKTILAGDNDEAKAAMLACSRLIRAPLSVKEVAKNLNSKNKSLSQAAELYLESEDSPEARSIVLSLHPNEAKVMGATIAFFPEKNSDLAVRSFEGLGELFASVNGAYGGRSLYLMDVFGRGSPFEEKELGDEVKANNELLGIYRYQDNFIRIFKDKAVLSWVEDESRYRERDLTKEEFDEIAGYLRHHNADQLSPFLGCADYGCAPKMLSMIGKSGGRRVFSLTERTPKFFEGLENVFRGFRQTQGKLRYNLEKEVPGLEILFADEKMTAQSVWKSGSDFRLLVADESRAKEIAREIEAQAETWENDAVDEEAEAAVQEKIWELGRKREFENFSWFSFAENRLGPVTSRPLQIEYPPAGDNLAARTAKGQWRAKAAGVEVKAEPDGLYLTAGSKPVKIRSGNYHSPVVTPNGKWAVVHKENDEGGELVRVNLVTKREFPISGEEAPTSAVAFVASVNLVLVSDGYYDEDGSWDWYGAMRLLDPETGRLQPVKGELRPILQQSFRPLQQTVNLYQFWAAIPDHENRSTSFGIYDSRTFSFKPMLKIPKIVFDSMDMWVDAGKIYFVYNGHLLALPIPAAK